MCVLQLWLACGLPFEKKNWNRALKMGQHTGLLVLSVTNILCPKLTRRQKNARVKTNPSRLQRRRRKRKRSRSYRKPGRV